MSSVSLEEVVKSNLANYEARYDANDWSRMESMLVTTPDSSPFNWKPVLITFVALIVLGGGYAVYTTIDFSKPAEKPASNTPPPVVKKQTPAPVKKTVPPPVVHTPVINADSLKQFEEAAAIAKAEEERKETELREKEERRERENRKEKISEREKEPVEKKERKELSKEELELKRARRRALATSDSGKTDSDSGRTSESSKQRTRESEKKEKAKSSSSVGLNIFSTFNADSLKKYQEKSKKDSVK